MAEAGRRPGPRRRVAPREVHALPTHRIEVQPVINNVRSLRFGRVLLVGGALALPVLLLILEPAAHIVRPRTQAFQHLHRPSRTLRALLRGATQRVVGSKRDFLTKIGTFGLCRSREMAVKTYWSHNHCDCSAQRQEWRRRRVAPRPTSPARPLSPAPSPARPLAPAPRVQGNPKHHLDDRGRWLILRGFVSGEEVGALLNKMQCHLARGELRPNPCGPGRFFAKVDDAPATYVDPLLTMLTARCVSALRLENVPVDLVLGRILSLLQPGGFIHGHTDAYPPGHRAGFEHLRANIVVRLRHPSGRPVIDGEPLPVEEGDLWTFYASRTRHETHTLSGSDPRIVIGFGWSVPAGHALQPPPGGDN